MILNFCLFFAIGKMFKKALKKRKTAKDIKMPNPKRGSMGIEFTDDSELASIILSCIANNEL